MGRWCRLDYRRMAAATAVGLDLDKKDYLIVWVPRAQASVEVGQGRLLVVCLGCVSRS